MKIDYNQFTKAELASFLNKHGEDFKYTIKPYQVILEEKQEKVFAEIEKVNKENSLLIKEMGDGDISQQIKISKEMDENSKRWKNLNKELFKIHDLLMKEELRRRKKKNENMGND